MSVQRGGGQGGSSAWMWLLGGGCALVLLCGGGAAGLGAWGFYSVKERFEGAMGDSEANAALGEAEGALGCRREAFDRVRACSAADVFCPVEAVAFIATCLERAEPDATWCQGAPLPDAPTFDAWAKARCQAEGFAGEHIACMAVTAGLAAHCQALPLPRPEGQEQPGRPGQPGQPGQPTPAEQQRAPQPATPGAAQPREHPARSAADP